MDTKYEVVTECVKNEVDEGFKKICSGCGKCGKNQLRIFAVNELSKAMNISNKQAEAKLINLRRVH